MRKSSVVAILFVAVLFLSACGSNNKTEVTNTGNSPATTVAAKTNTNTDSAIATFNKVKEAYNKNDVNLFKQQLTKGSLDQFNAISTPTQGEYLDVEQVTITLSQDAEFIKETKEGASSIITAKVTNRDGKVRTLDHVFVKEDGVWKFDWVTSLQRAQG